MYKYQIKNLKLEDLKEAGATIQYFIDYNQCSLLAANRKILVNNNGGINSVFMPDGIGFVGDVLLPEGLAASKMNEEFADCLAQITIQVDNYLAKIICNAVDEDNHYENLKIFFYDPEDITEVSFACNFLDIDKFIDGFIDDCIDELEYIEVTGCFVIENQLFGVCLVEQLINQVKIGVKVNEDGKIVEIVYLHSYIMGV